MIEDKIKSLVDKLKIKKNEVIMLHGDAAVIGQLDIKNINYNLEIFFDQIINKVGKKGAILIPTFTYSFIKKKNLTLKSQKVRLDILVKYLEIEKIHTDIVIRYLAFLYMARKFIIRKITKIVSEKNLYLMIFIKIMEE